MSEFDCVSLMATNNLYYDFDHLFNTKHYCIVFRNNKVSTKFRNLDSSVEKPKSEAKYENRDRSVLFNEAVSF